MFLVDVILSCGFTDDVLCSYRDELKFAVMNRCLKCPEYLRFLREMDEEDERVMDEIDAERRRRGERV